MALLEQLSRHLEPRLIGTEDWDEGNLSRDNSATDQKRAPEDAIRDLHPGVDNILQQAGVGYAWLSLIGQPENANVALLPFVFVRRQTFPVEDRDDKWGEFDYSYPVTLCDVAVSNPLPGKAQVSVVFGSSHPAVEKQLQQGEVFWCRFHDESGQNEHSYKPKPHEVFVGGMHDIRVTLVGDNGIVYEGWIESEFRGHVRLTLRPKQIH